MKVWVATFGVLEETRTVLTATRELALAEIVKHVPEAEWQQFVKSLRNVDGVNADLCSTAWDNREASPSMVLDAWFGPSNLFDGGEPEDETWGDGAIYANVKLQEVVGYEDPDMQCYTCNSVNVGPFSTDQR